MRTIQTLLVLAALLTAASLSGCNVLDDDRDTEPLGFENVPAGAISVPEPRTIVFRHQETWAEFYTAHDLTLGPTSQVPVFDFDAVTLAVVAWGPTGGCGDRNVEAIRGVAWNAQAVLIDVGPLPRDPSPCPSFFYPLQVITFPRLDLPVVFTGAVPG